MPGRTGWPWTEESPQLPDTMPDGRPWPRVSIVTPSYNQGQFIEETIRSVLLQGYPDLEYIIIDGGSTDGSVDIIRKYEPWLAYWVSEPDRGQVHAINKGFQRATGEILAWLNSDDVYCPGSLEAVAQTLTQHPQAAILCGACVLVDGDGHTIGTKGPREFTPEHFLQGGGVPGQPAVFFRRSVLERVGGLNENLHYVLDWEFWLRISLQYPPKSMVQVDRLLAQARIWAQAKTTTAGMKGIEERQRILSQLFSDARLPDHLRRLQSIAHSDLHWRWAFLRWDEASYLLALRHMLQAVWEHPRPWIYARKLYHLAWAIWHRKPVHS